MDSFFGIGAPELILILIVAGIVMGPQRIGQVARWLGKTTAQLQAISRTFLRQLNAELNAVDEGGDIKSAMKEVQELRRQVTNLRRELTSVAVGATQEGKKAVRESRELLKEMVELPTLTAEPDDAPEPSDNESSPQTQLPNLLEVPDDPE